MSNHQPDKNLKNTTKELNRDGVNSLQEQQLQQKKNDRRKEMLRNK